MENAEDEMSIHQSRGTDHFQQLCDIVAQLRAPGGCPWDREQTHASILPQLIEEAYELVGAVQANDTANLREELGDLLLHIVMHAEMAPPAGTCYHPNLLSQVAKEI